MTEVDVYRYVEMEQKAEDYDNVQNELDHLRQDRLQQSIGKSIKSNIDSMKRL